jgi:hypothetical protein
MSIVAYQTFKKKVLMHMTLGCTCFQKKIKIKIVKVDS